MQFVISWSTCEHYEVLRVREARGVAVYAERFARNEDSVGTRGEGDVVIDLLTEEQRDMLCDVLDYMRISRSNSGVAIDSMVIDLGRAAPVQRSTGLRAWNTKRSRAILVDY